MDHIQIVQTVQTASFDPADEVPLIFGRCAIARVFLKSKEAQPATGGITGQLTAAEFRGVALQ